MKNEVKVWCFLMFLSLWSNTKCLQCVCFTNYFGTNLKCRFNHARPFIQFNRINTYLERINYEKRDKSSLLSNFSNVYFTNYFKTNL